MSDLFRTRSTSIPHCQCLYEIENNLPRTKYCFVSCNDQLEIIAERKKAENHTSAEDDNKS